MPTPETQHIDALLSWLRTYFAVSAFVCLSIAGLGGWYASLRRDRWMWILYAMGVVYATSIPFHWGFTNDDSFIFYRYAENLASGMGPVYNPGVACEGFTSAAWTYILALGSILGVSTLWLSKVLGAILGAVSIFMMILSVRHICTDARVVFMTSLFVTTSQIFIAWIPSGMDTALFMAWLSTWVYVLVSRPTGFLAQLLLAAIGVWVRPEAYFVILVGIAWGQYTQRNEPSPARRHALVGLTLIAMLPPLVWRYFTFGELLPITFYAKSDRTLRNGIGFLFGAVNGYGAAVWAIALIGLWKLRRTIMWAGILLVVIAGYAVWVGGDVLIQRFSLWWMPIVTLGLAAGIREIVGTKLLDSRLVLPLIAMLLTGQELHRMYTVTRPGSQNDGYAYVSSNSVHTAEADAPIGRYLREHGTASDTVFTDNIGAIGYYSGMVIVDVLGLVDSEVALLIHDGSRSEISRKLITRRPHWIAGYEVPGTALLQMPNVGILPQGFIDGYERAGRWQSRAGYTRILLKRSERN